MLRYALICSVKPALAERVCHLKSGLFLTPSLMFMFVAANVSDAAETWVYLTVMYQTVQYGKL